MIRLLAIDPGTVRLGWAIFHHTPSNPPDHYVKLIAASVLNLKNAISQEAFAHNQTNSKSSLQICHASYSHQFSSKFILANRWLQRAQDATSQITELANRNGISHAVIEMPEHQGGSRGAQAEGTGAILKLTFLVGLITQSLMTQGIRVRLVNVRNWKGTVKKTMTQARMRKRWGTLPSDSPDAIDAIGIGTWMLCKRKP